MRISVFASKELQAVTIAMRNLDRENAKQLRKATKANVLPIWKESVRGHTTSRLEERVLTQTATVLVRDDNITLRSASSVKRLSGGGTVSDLAHSTEFGAVRDTRNAEGRNGGSPYKRQTRNQFRPRNRKGYTVYPAASDAIPRVASLWVSTIVRGIRDAFEGK
jgi:hypothetical protein